MHQSTSFRLTMKQLFLIIVVVCFQSISAQFPLTNGTCSNFNECRDPNVEITKEKIAGIWFIHSEIPFFSWESKKCSYYNYTALPEPNALEVQITEFDVK